jgi:hypothetical protein
MSGFDWMIGLWRSLLAAAGGQKEYKKNVYAIRQSAPHNPNQSPGKNCIMRS